MRLDFPLCLLQYDSHYRLLAVFLDVGLHSLFVRLVKGEGETEIVLVLLPELFFVFVGCLVVKETGYFILEDFDFLLREPGIDCVVAEVNEQSGQLIVVPAPLRFVEGYVELSTPI